jgi:hypothetical protein
MAVAFAPFDESDTFLISRPPKVVVNKGLPVSDNTECNFIVMGFIVGIFVLGLVDSMRGSK